ncbi:MAG TPA: class I SAM-dependent methyltransferase [Desulfotomaculum sp.]|nr:MAG: Uncharacterized protein XD84_1509 [Desulfotomaculum sp. 46_80]HAG10666.1 class I SAM-dependent methyltransferase [Desulfotomaculum sp.]HBY03791.1 class I SAM-dependent methyltransferase [Desulfotomaculum sp.]
MDYKTTGVSSWYYDERKNAGVDYTDSKIAAEYDIQHSRFRDFEKDARLIMEKLELKPEHTVIDFGCGTGAFVIPTARLCRKIYAVDISQAMLNRCLEKARAAGLSNIEPHCAGFLTYEHKEAPVDAIVSVVALHHLPDFWKVVALKRMYDMLKPGGRLFLFDVVFSFSIGEFQSKFENWVSGMLNNVGQEMAEETIIHIRDEYSTFDWLMDEMIKRVGFKIEQKFSDFPFCLTYLSIRP